MCPGPNDKCPPASLCSLFPRAPSMFCPCPVTVSMSACDILHVCPVFYSNTSLSFSIRWACFVMYSGSAILGRVLKNAFFMDAMWCFRCVSLLFPPTVLWCVPLWISWYSLCIFVILWHSLSVFCDLPCLGSVTFPVYISCLRVTLSASDLNSTLLGEVVGSALFWDCSALDVTCRLGRWASLHILHYYWLAFPIRLFAYVCKGSGSTAG